MSEEPITLAVLISGSGTTLVNLVEHIAAGKLLARIGVVIASRPAIAGIDRARNAGLPCQVIARNDYPDVESFSRDVFARCQQAGAQLVCLAGWLSLLQIPKQWEGRVINIHPALLPNFGGKGMYGHHVHQAVLQSGDKQSGCTVHYATNQYDSGPIILQRTCPVLPDDTAETLARRVFEEEKIAYPQAIEMIRKGLSEQ